MFKNICAVLFCLLYIIGCGGTKPGLNSDINKLEENNILGYKGKVFFSSSIKPHVLLHRSIGKESHIIWGTGNHTSSFVPIGSIGPEKYISKLKGIIPNTQIAEVMKEAVKDGISVIIVIGDGMGINHMSLPIYMNIAEGNKKITYFEKIMKEGQSGFVTTNPDNGLVTCSSASATAIACGTKTLLGMVGVDNEGNILESALEVAKKEGYRVGVVSDVDIVDATPACFYAHHIDRGAKDDIAKQLADRNDIDVILGGGANYFIPTGKKIKDEKGFNDFEEWQNLSSGRNDSLDLILVMEKNGYKVIHNEDQLKNVNRSEEKVLGLFAGGAISAAIDRDDEKTKEPSLVLMAEKNIDILSNGNKKFFTMIECGRIDWEAHNNDAGSVFKAVSEMNLVLEKAYEYYDKNKENTLLIFTADHETGSLGIAYNKFKESEKLSKTTVSGKKWKSSTDPLLFKNFLKLKEQKISINKIYEKAKSIEELRNLFKQNLGYDLEQEDIIMIFNSFIK